MKNSALVIISFLFFEFCNAQLYINEVMSNNQNTVTDNHDDYSDWIELYNGGTSAVNLQGYYFSDDPDSMMKWRIPQITIGPNSFVTFWCSGRNAGSISNPHTNFSLDSRGENIFLSNPSGIVVDNIPVNYLVADKSFGRFPDGGSNLVYLSKPTFKATNNNSSVINGVVTTPPQFNIPGGFYTTDQNIILTHPDPSVTIHYTLDGSDPTEYSPVYTAPINVHSRVGDVNYYSTIRTCYPRHSYLPAWYPPIGEVFKCTVLRARAIKSGFFPGPVQTYTYFIDPSMFTRYGNLPVVSVVSDPKNLFNDTTGIYVPGINYNPNTYDENYYQDWDRPANIEMYLPGGVNVFNSSFRVNINGQSSPSSPQKGFNVNASYDYGIDKIEYPLFENTNGRARYIREFDKFKLRAWGSDRKKTLFRDAFCSEILNKTDLDIEAYQPIVVFIDGEYWGLQELRERNRDGSYFQSHFFIDKKNPGFDILDGAGFSVIEGDSLDWVTMIDYINHHNPNNPTNYNYVKAHIDVNSFMLNYMASIYFARGDWPDQNEAKWRPRIQNGKWRWIQWDMDNTLGYDLSPWYDMFDLVISGSASYGPSPLLKKLLLSSEFKKSFINLFADYMNTSFLPGVTDAKVNSMRSELLPYFTEFQDRWQLNSTYMNATDTIIWWLGKRPQYVKQHIMDQFNLSGIYDLTLDVSDTLKGNIKVNTVFLDNNTDRVTASTYPWTGQYFKGVPVPLTAKAKPGFRFVKWLQTNDTNQTILLNLTRDSSMTALFDIDPNYHSVMQPIINEVMSANTTTIADNFGEYDDWLEIYNPNNDTIDIGGYYLTDCLVLPTRFHFQTGNDSTKIPPHGFLLVWIDDDTSQGLLHASFKFESHGDFIALVSTDGESVVDSFSIPALQNNISYGRIYDAATQFVSFNPSTPNATNHSTANERVVINELQTGNISTIKDNYNQYDQWIELYNPYPDTIDLADWKISNDSVNFTGFTFGQGNDSTKIKGYGFKLLWADNQTNQGVLHLNFNLQQSGCLFIKRQNGDLADSVCYSAIANDKSYGRLIDGDPTWKTFSKPTPDSNNVDVTFINDIAGSNDVLTGYPNPIRGGELYLNKFVSFYLCDALGRKLVFISDNNHIDLTPFESGVYYIMTERGEAIKIIRN